MLVASDELAHLHLKDPTYVHSVHDSQSGRALSSITMQDLLKPIKIRRLDGQPVTSIPQDTINQYTFHFIRNS